MLLRDLRLAPRLGGGFAAVLVLMASILAVGLWRLDAATAETQATLGLPLRKERLTEEMLRIASLSVRRTMAIAKSADTSLERVFADDIKTTTARSNEILKTIEALPLSEGERAGLASIAEARKPYIAARDTVIDLKRKGRLAEADDVYAQRFLPLSVAYQRAIADFVGAQHAAIDASADRLDRESRRAAAWMLGLGLLGLATGVVLSIRLTQSITRPIADASALAESVAAGDLSARIDTVGRDEIAGLTRALDKMTGNLRAIVADVRSASDRIDAASAEVASGHQDLSGRTAQAAANLQQTASSVAQITSGVSHSADAARDAERLASSAVRVAATGGVIVGQVVATMDDISASSKKIAEIIGVIDGIAFQTNILALNAAVESARAGAQGRGFAVVAGEVRMLARRSAEAAQEIKQLIGASVGRVADGSRLVGDAGRTMSEIVGSVEQVSQMIRELSRATCEQSSGLGAVHGAVVQLDRMTQQNAALVEQSLATAGSLKEQAGQLSLSVTQFRLEAARA